MRSQLGPKGPSFCLEVLTCEGYLAILIARAMFIFNACGGFMAKKLPMIEDAPVKLTRSSDKLVANVEDALLRLSDAKAEVKQASQLLKLALNALSAARRVDPNQVLLDGL